MSQTRETILFATVLFTKAWVTQPCPIFKSFGGLYNMCACMYVTCACLHRFACSYVQQCVCRSQRIAQMLVLTFLVWDRASLFFAGYTRLPVSFLTHPALGEQGSSECSPIQTYSYLKVRRFCLLVCFCHFVVQLQNMNFADDGLCVSMSDWDETCLVEDHSCCQPSGGRRRTEEPRYQWKGV